MGLAFLVLVGCGLNMNMVDVVSEDLIDLNELETKADSIISTHTPEEAQQNLVKLAPMFARAISENKGLKDLLAVEVAKKFDGDNDVLYDMIASKTTKQGKTVETLIKQNIQLCGDEVSFNDLVDSIPYFNISIPVHFEQWSTYDGPIYVIPMRYDIDDMEIEALQGYDENGNVKMFPADTPPEFPVIVLGINERMNLLNTETRHENSSLKEEVSLMEETPRLNHDAYLSGIKIIADLDPWYSGAPEVYALYAVGENGQKLHQNYAEVDNRNTWYTYSNPVIFSYENSPENMYWMLKFREADFDWGKYINFTLSSGYTYEGENYNISATFTATEKLITNQDDNYGDTQVFFYHQLNESGYTEYYVGGASIRVGYLEYPIK